MYWNKREILHGNLICQGTLTALDLQDVYLYVPINQSHQRYLRFAIQTKSGLHSWHIRLLPFGLSAATHIFTKILARRNVSTCTKDFYFTISGWLSSFCPRQRNTFLRSKSCLGNIPEIWLGGDLRQINLDPFLSQLQNRCCDKNNSYQKEICKELFL